MTTTNEPRRIPPWVWKEIARVPRVSEGYGLGDLPENERGAFLASTAYGVAFEDFMSGGPGYFGPLYIVQDDALGAAPLVFRRNSIGELEAIDFSQ